MDPLNLEALMTEAHQTAADHGWWEPPERTFGDQVALMHSELSESLEEFRRHSFEKNIYFVPTPSGDKPEGIAAEFADVLIRIFDTCKRYDIPLAKALLAKMDYNKSRPYRHGGKAI